MKKVILALTALVLNTFLFSCTSDSIAELDAIYETHATEGDDGDIKPPPPPPK